MSFLLDTNIISDHLKRPSASFHRFVQHSGRLAVPTIVLGELYAWAFGRSDPATILGPLERIGGATGNPPVRRGKREAFRGTPRPPQSWRPHRGLSRPHDRLNGAGPRPYFGYG